MRYRRLTFYASRCIDARDTARDAARLAIAAWADEHYAPSIMSTRAQTSRNRRTHPDAAMTISIPATSVDR
jgi:D-alanyl-D-alanine carboxypeptidase